MLGSIFYDYGMLGNWYVLFSCDKNDWIFIFRELDFLFKYFLGYD